MVAAATFITRWGTRALLLVSFAVLLIIGVGPHTGKYRVYSVLSGSMEPTIPTGAMVIVKPENVDKVAVGQVLTFERPLEDRQVITHRVTQVERNAEIGTVIATKGDANTAADPWSAQLLDKEAWYVVGHVPYAGKLIWLFRDERLRSVAIYALPSLFAVFGLISVWTRPNQDDDDTDGAGTGGGGGSFYQPKHAAPVPTMGALVMQKMNFLARWTRPATAVVVGITVLFAPSSAEAAPFTGSIAATHTAASVALASATGLTRTTSCNGLLGLNGNTINLSWVRSTTLQVDGYRIERSLDGGSYTLIADVAGGSTLTYSDSGRANNSNYWYRVTARLGTGAAQWTSPTSAALATTSGACLFL